MYLYPLAVSLNGLCSTIGVLARCYEAAVKEAVEAGYKVDGVDVLTYDEVLIETHKSNGGGL
jgi:hypothetical protein